MPPPTDTVPPCYALVHAGLEPIAADELTRDHGGEVKKTARGLVVFRVPTIDDDLLALRTTEDVFMMAWGSDSLTFKAADLNTIRQWTAKKADWKRLLQLHSDVKGRPKGKPTFNLVCQMQGEHGYRRVDALDAMADGLGGKVPVSYTPSDENAYLEIWLTIRGRTAVCGVRLSDRTMRHRTYKRDHVAASLRPTFAAAMVRLLGAAPGMTVLDPMCGAGTLLAEQLELSRRRRAGHVELIGGDSDPNAIFCAKQNLDRMGPVTLQKWDATDLPIGSATVDRIVCNLPFGVQLSSPEKIGPLYQSIMPEWDRVLKPGGRAVLLASEEDVLRQAVNSVGWVASRQYRGRVLGQSATIGVWQKPFDSATMPE